MKRKLTIPCLLLLSLLLAGCVTRTVDEMYRLPKRSETYNKLQAAIDGAMEGLEYCAPISGEYQQTVQMADLDGDGKQEFLLFAKGGTERPLKILIFKEQDKACRHVQTIECNGTAFDQVSYVQMDGEAGVELIVGRQLSDQVPRAVSVYAFSKGEPVEVISSNYSKFLTPDLDGDGTAELFVLMPGRDEAEKGIAQLYRILDGTAERSVEVNMSEPVSKLKRILTGRLSGGQMAVYAASTVDTSAIITDVFTVVDGELRNVSLSNESGTSVKTIRNFYIYADDIDGDGEMELPTLLPPAAEEVGDAKNNGLIRWYSLTREGEEMDKLYTLHSFDGGWYMELDGDLAPSLCVERRGNEYEVFLWNTDASEREKLLVITAISGQHREEAAAENNSFILSKTDTTVYAAALEACAGQYGFTEKSVMNAFHLISPDWKTGEA